MAAVRPAQLSTENSEEPILTSVGIAVTAQIRPLCEFWRGLCSRCSCSLQANSMKELIEIVYDLLIEAIQLSSFVILEFGVGLVRLK